MHEVRVGDAGTGDVERAGGVGRSSRRDPFPVRHGERERGHAAAVAKDAADAGHAAAEPPKIRAAGGGAAAAPSASGSASPVECGTKPLPDCPLQAWMKAHANPPVLTSDLPALAKALDEIALFAPAGYTNWASISKDGAAAARAGDLTAAKASCRSCHDQYKQKYKTEIRARKI